MIDPRIDPAVALTTRSGRAATGSYGGQVYHPTVLDRITKSAAKRARRAIERPFLVEPRFVIVGTGRSGTGYIAALLRAGGIRCGHEGWWSPLDRRRPRLQGDASWCATFELDDYDGRIFHQIRDPLATMRSVAAVEVAPHRRENAWYRYRTKFVEFTGDPMTDALLTLDRWLTKAEAIAEWTWRLEDVDVSLVAEIGARLGLPVDTAAVVEAISLAPRNEAQTKKLETFDFTWDDLPERAEKRRVIEIAQRYGYR